MLGWCLTTDIAVNFLSVKCFFSFFQAVLAGDLILSVASIALARIGNTAVTSLLTQVIEDLVRGKLILTFLFYSILVLARQ